jgi:hypothetical protein
MREMEEFQSWELGNLNRNNYKEKGKILIVFIHLIELKFSNNRPRRSRTLTGHWIKLGIGTDRKQMKIWVWRRTMH